jgi:hypothetical protein
MLISLLVVVLVLCVVYWAVHRLAAAFGLPPTIVTVLDVGLVIVGVLYVLRAFGLAGAF